MPRADSKQPRPPLGNRFQYVARYCLEFSLLMYFSSSETLTSLFCGSVPGSRGEALTSCILFSLVAGGGRSFERPSTRVAWLTISPHESRKSFLYIERPSWLKVSRRCSRYAEHSALLYGVVKAPSLNTLCTTLVCNASHR